MIRATFPWPHRGAGWDAMRHPRGPRAGSCHSRYLSETIRARPIPLRSDDRDRLPDLGSPSHLAGR